MVSFFSSIMGIHMYIYVLRCELMALLIIIIYIYCILGQFTVPSVSGQCCPPTSSFTINKINQNKGIMFGGLVTNDGLGIPTNNVYIFNVTHNTIVSYYYYHVQYMFIIAYQLYYFY